MTNPEPQLAIPENYKFAFKIGQFVKMQWDENANVRTYGKVRLPIKKRILYGFVYEIEIEFVFDMKTEAPKTKVTYKTHCVEIDKMLSARGWAWSDWMRTNFAHIEPSPIHESEIPSAVYKILKKELEFRRSLNN